MILPYFSWVTNGVPKDSGQGVSGCNSNEFAVSRVCIFWHVQRCLKNLGDHEDPKTGQPLSFFSCSVTCSVAYFLAELVGRFCRTFRYLAVERISSKMFGVGFPFLQGPFVFFWRRFSHQPADVEAEEAEPEARMAIDVMEAVTHRLLQAFPPRKVAG